MVSLFQPAIELVLAHEGGFNEVEGDLGGATNWGVSLRYLRTLVKDQDGDGFPDGDVDHDGDVDRDDIRAMTRGEAVQIYYGQWWLRYDYGLIDRNHQAIANKIMDLCVNMGPRRVGRSGKIWGAHVILQKAVNTLKRGRLIEDGRLGGKSFAAINEAEPHALLVDFRLAALDTYEALIARNPKLGKFRKGWRRRAVSI